MMLLGTITIPASPWAWPVAALGLTALVLLVWSYRRAAQTGPMPRIAFSLKLLGVLALTLCLIEPLWSGRRAKAGANLFAIVADNSSGMNLRDRDGARSRGEALQEILKTGESGWRAALAENFQLRQYLFDSRLRRTADFSDLVFDGKATALGSTLRTLAERYRGRPLAGILLLTDGCATDASESAYDLAGVPPVYAVALDQGRPLRDLAVANVTVSQTSFEDAPVTVQAVVEARGFAGASVPVSLLDNADKPVERQQWNIGRDNEKQTFRFRFRPDQTGVLFYRIRVGEETSGGHDDTRPTPPMRAAQPSDGQRSVSEATLVNNERTVVVDRGKGPYRILYVAGRPNWDLKFLKRAIEEDEQVQLVVLLRVARREPKYDWRGHSGESTNPLYRGFDPEDNEKTEEYDQPVLVRLNTRDEVEVRDGFPKTKEDLFEYCAVIFDDVEVSFFTHEQMDLVRRFVAERGGGFLMLGGQDSFQRGGFDRTPIGSILPVYLDALPAVDQPPATRLDLTREGWLQPWARLRDNESQERQRLTEMPEFQVLNRLRAGKPGAAIVATAGIGEDQKLPALAVQRLGNGRTAALAVGDTWRWGMRDPQRHNDMDKFWRQTLRWLIADVPGRITIQATQKMDETNQSVTLRVRVRDKGFEPMDDVSVVVDVCEPGGGTVKLAAAPVAAERGLLEAVYVPRTSGGYLAQATIAGADGSKLGEVQTGWTAELEAREFQSITTNRPLLERVTRQTGGRMVEPGELDKFARTLPRREAPISETWARPLWDLPGIQPALFLLALSCFIAEWALRRWKGMP
jgi:uncharacterized membrane protein